MTRIGVVVGTRPEAIKLAPLVLALRETVGMVPVVVATGQHRDLARPLLAGFGVGVDLDLDLSRSGHALTELTGAAVSGLGQVIRDADLEAIVVQGDTSTAVAGALAGFYARIPVIHLEAGLRSGDRRSPFPEEVNRRLITQLADLHLAPTQEAAARLTAEGVLAEAIVVTGNTVVDALLRTARLAAPYAGPDAMMLAAIDPAARVVLVTAHRRESWGEGIERIAEAVAELVAAHDDLVAVVPLHPNPTVREAIRSVLGDRPRIMLTEPLPYSDLVRLLTRSTLVITDSGGIQEEACTLGKPTLVARDTTERPEGVTARGLRLVGTDPGRIVAAADLLLGDPLEYEALVCRSLPFGDGLAAPRAAAAITALLTAHRTAPDRQAAVV